MKEKKNDLWKLDLLEAKFTQTTPRFPFTKKLLSARNNTRLLKKLPATPNEAFRQIHALRADIFAKKYHGSYTRLSREVQGKLKYDQRTWTDAHAKLRSLFDTPDFTDQLLCSKLAKIIQNAVLDNGKLDPPAYLPPDVRTHVCDDSSPKNPSHFFVTHCQNDKSVDDYISQLWNSAKIKKILQEIDWSFRKIRGNLTPVETASRTKHTGKPSHGNKNRAVGDDNEVSGSDDDEVSGPKDEKMDAEVAFDKFAAYDNMVGDSDDDAEFEADPNVDYNQVSDEELPHDYNTKAAESRSQTTKEKKKIVLPSFATGYFSGGSDDEDVDNDKVVKEATTVRKNRRGQRARQKIWEQKYGSKAAHVQKEHQRISSEREQKQKEFEERQRKRELKAQAAQENSKYKDANAKPISSHPSWEAKKKAEEKMKNAKFQGKKITFD